MVNKNPDLSHRFQKGQSGNPGGRKKSLPGGVVRIQELARAYTEEALETLAKIMRNEEASDSSRVAASIGLLDRGWGKPPQAITGADGGPIQTETQLLGLSDLDRDERAALRDILGRRAAARNAADGGDQGS